MNNRLFISYGHAYHLEAFFVYQILYSRRDRVNKNKMVQSNLKGTYYAPLYKM